VPPSLSEPSIDPERSGWFNDPDYFAVLARLRGESPVHRYAPGSWVVAGYDDVREVSRDTARFCSGKGVLMDDPLRQGMELPGSILHMDPPEHAQWRKVASRWFTPRAVAGLEGRIRELASELLDGVDPTADIDAVEALAAPLPIAVIAEMLGVDVADRDRFRHWSDALIESPDGDGAGLDEITRMERTAELLGFLDDQVTERRAEPRDDLLSVLIAAEVDGRALEDHEVVMYALSMLVAGNETTRHVISGSLAALAEHADQRATLIAEPLLMADAVEECLRWITPIQLFARTALADTELGGQAIAEGDWVVMLYASANRDEAVWGESAGAFDARREPNPAHVAFGFGEHLCLGAGLARLEARVFLDELLARHPRYELAGDPTWTKSLLVRGMATLPVRLG